MPRETSIGGSRRLIEPTVWTIILKARDEKQMGALIERYWKPCYFFIRRRGHDQEDAKDLAQGFFTDIIERDALASVTKSKGRFRNFLLACLDHYLANEYDRRNAKKRSAKLVSLDFDGAEIQLAETRVDTPERAYRRQWAVAIIERAMGALKKEMGPRFQALRGFIIAGQPGTIKEVAEKLGLTESNVKVIIHRARKRYKELLRHEVSRTVEDSREVDEELAEIFNALS